MALAVCADSARDVPEATENPRSRHATTDLALLFHRKYDPLPLLRSRQLETSFTRVPKRITLTSLAELVY